MLPVNRRTPESPRAVERAGGTQKRGREGPDNADRNYKSPPRQCLTPPTLSPQAAFTHVPSKFQE